MKWILRISFCVVLVGILLFIAIWISLPSVEEFRLLAKTRPLYCATLVDRDGISLGPLYSLPGQSEYAPLDSIPIYIIDDLIFFEDRSFYDWYNFGINIQGLARAILKQGPGGGSGLTQQLYRIVTGHKERSIYRKSLELVAAVKLWFGLKKDEVLELYLNNAFFGAGSRLGITAAAYKFFSKKPSELTRAEGIMLISFLNRPPGKISLEFGPIYEKYYKRVERLDQAGMISPDDPDYPEIIKGPEFNLGVSEATSFGVFIDRALTEAKQILSGTNWSLEFDGLIVETTLNRQINDSVSTILKSQLQQFYKVRGSLVMFNQENEVIVYIAGGQSFPGGFDDLQSNQIMPASRFKVLAYALAIETLLSKGLMKQADVLNYSLPTLFQVTKGFVVSDPGPSSVYLRRAISESKNACAYYVSNNITSPKEIVTFAEKFGGNRLEPYPSIALGTQGFSEFNLCWAYSTILVRNGYLKSPTFVRRIMTRDSKVLYDATEKFKGRKEPKIVSIKTCKILRQALRESVEEGTGRYFQHIPSFKSRDLAIKTGTSQKNLHLGVTGSIDDYTFSLLLQGKNLHGPASAIAVPIAVSILSKAVEVLK